MRPTTTLPILSIASTLTQITHGLLQKRQFDPSVFDWSSVPPSPSLNYKPCYKSFKCARLQVPLDWKTANITHPISNSTDSQIATIAIITLPATIPPTHPSFGGPVLINPGGPGGSGTEMALQYGAYIQSILDGDRHYEILGFDPRGVGLSTPRADCYAGDRFARTADAFQKEGIPAVMAGEAGLEFQFAAAKGFSEVCGQAGKGSIFEFMSTASVARDMLEIVEKADLARGGGARYGGEKPGLQYLGVSYGTILGSTFASMFPERVERMVLDGVADAKDYVTGAWRKNLDDAETVIDHFYATCLQARSLCPLYQPTDNSTASIRARVDALIADFSASPVPVVSSNRVRLVTSLLLRDAIRQSLYAPIATYAILSQTLGEALQGNYTLLLQSPPGQDPSRDETCDAPSSDFPPQNYAWSNDASIGILCGDSAALAGPRDNTSWALASAQFLQDQSPTTGEPWSRIGLSCAGWEYSPKYVYPGPFGANTSTPLLVLSNRYDQATPLDNAKALASQYPGSGLVVQEAWGHVALLTSRSECTAKYVREYFESGKVPEEGRTCQPECQAEIPFEACEGFIEQGGW